MSEQCHLSTSLIVAASAWATGPLELGLSQRCVLAASQLWDFVPVIPISQMAFLAPSLLHSWKIPPIFTHRYPLPPATGGSPRAWGLTHHGCRQRVGPELRLLPSGSDCGFYSTGPTGWGGQKRKERRRGQPPLVPRSCWALLEFLTDLLSPCSMEVSTFTTVTSFWALCCPPYSYTCPANLRAPGRTWCQALRTSCQQRQAKADSIRGLCGTGSSRWGRAWSVCSWQETQEAAEPEG